MEQPVWNFEQEPYDEHADETSYNLRAYFDRMDDAKMQQYDPAWSDEQLMQWDDNFTNENTLLLACCERDIEPEEYRRVIAQAIAYRHRVRPFLSALPDPNHSSGVRNP
jgi:hypothetical protein